MKKKAFKQRKRRRSVRREARLVHVTRRESLKKEKVTSVSLPWLQMVTSGIEDDLKTDVSRGCLSLRNAGCRPGGVAKYMPEGNSRGR